MTKNLFLVLFLSTLAISTQASFFDDYQGLRDFGEEMLANYLNHEELDHVFGKHTTKIVMNSVQSLYNNPILFEQVMTKILNFDRQKAEEAILTCSKGNKPDFFKLVKKTVGVVGQNGDKESITLDHLEDDCYGQMDVDYEKLSSTSVKVTMTPYNKTSEECYDQYLLATAITLKPIRFNDTDVHEIVLENLSERQMKNIVGFGMHIFRTCDKMENILMDTLITAGMFMGGFGTNPNIPIFGSKPTWWMEELSTKFIKEGNGYEWQKRKDVFHDLNETHVKPGDYIIITRMDGLDNIVHWGSGSRNGHSVTLLDIDGELTAVESQDGWYWPKRHIQRNSWKQWKQWAQNAGFNVAILPLRDDIRAKFNNTAAVEWFKKVEGQPYGYHNFIFGWIDTAKESFPELLDLDFLYVVFSIIEHIVPEAATSIMGEALNMRLGTKGLKLDEIANEAHSRNLTIGELFAIPEQDGWVYSDGLSYVCSAFVAGVYKAGGLFDDMEIQATEFTPRDVYQLNFFDRNYTVPDFCAQDDPSIPYCQVMGKYLMDIQDDGYSTIDPYPNMFETCPSMPPKYERPLGC